MKKLSALVVFLVVAVLAGCAVDRGYHAALNEDDYGYLETKIQEDTYSIQYRGSDAHSVQRVADFALLRAAEITLEKGYRYFTVTGGQYNSENKTQTYASVGAGQFYPGYGWVGAYPVWQTFSSNYPVAFLMVHLFKDKPDNTPLSVFNAQEVKTNLRAHYRLDPPATAPAAPRPDR